MKSKKVTICDNAFQAELLLGQLKENGIQAYLTNEAMAGYPPLSGVTVYVDEEDYERAKSLLDVKGEDKA